MTIPFVGNYWRPISLVCLSLLIAGLYLPIAFTADPNRATAPLDDAYITFQYARQIALGQPYQYNAGDLPTTGMTSPLFALLLAGIYRLGFVGERLTAAVLALGAVWFSLAIWLTYQIGRGLGDGRLTDNQAWLAAVLVALTGAFQWASFNAMESVPFAVLGLSAIWLWRQERWHGSALCAALAALMRPEGLFLAGLLWLASALPHIRQRAWPPFVSQSTAVAVGLLPSFISWRLTGVSSSSGLLAKSWLYNVPYHAADIAYSIWLSAWEITLQFSGWAAVGQSFLPPLLFLFALAGWWQLARAGHWGWFVVTAGWFGLGALSSATLITATWHVGRYQAPFIPIVVIIASYGFVGLLGNKRQRWPQLLYYGLIVGWLALSLSATFHYQALYRRVVNNVAQQHLPLADWMRENLPTDARVGVHDVGSLRYVGERATYDLIGLTTAGAAIPWRHGAGAVYKLMENSPMRPDYFAIYPDVFSIPYLAQTDLFAEQLFEVHTPDFAVASAGPTQGVWRADWRLANSGAAIYHPELIARFPFWEQVGELDLADLTAETQYNFDWWQTIQRPGFPTEVYQFNYRAAPEHTVIDGGRLLTGGLALDVPTPHTADLWIVVRLHAQQAGGVIVQANGQEVGLWRYPEVAGQWLETVYPIPAHYLTTPVTHLTLTVSEAWPTLYYAPYYFWFFQGDGLPSPPTMDQPVTAIFGNEQQLHLRGWEAETRRRYAPGEQIPLTLFWEAARQSDSDARLFVHLYNAQGELVAQVDGWPYLDTLPPYNWLVGEIIVDFRMLPLPNDLPPGQYEVAVGLYEATGRLPIFAAEMRQTEDRLFLFDVEIGE
jgi:hypothetical protein